MAQRMQVIFEDDIDGSEAEGTVTFAFDGVGYEVDLSGKNRGKLLKALGPYIEAGRKVSARSSARRTAAPAARRHDQSAVREWARAEGMTVSGRGRIPADVLARYEAAH
jgi:Lsr2